MFNQENIKNERQWSAVVGMSSKKFDQLTEMFELAYETLEGVSISDAANNLKKTFILSTYAQCLFFVLYQLKNTNTYDVLGFHIGSDASTAHRLFDKYLKVLEHALFKNGQMPKRNFDNLEEFKILLNNQAEIILDVTEIPIQRHHHNQTQKEDFSGKKKAY